MNIKESLKEFYSQFREVSRTKATAQIEYEIQEMEHIFELLVFGVFTGTPAPPSHITTELLSVMPTTPEKLMHRSASAHDALGELAEILGEP